LTAKAVGWLESSIDRWISERVNHAHQAEVQ
jgi:predicted DNA-binding transcriptional regulator AlpA